MPIYEFRCEGCGAEFERLVEPGAQPQRCAECSSAEVRRIYSAPAAPFHLVKTPAQKRGQERRNAKLRERTRERFSRARQRARGGGGDR